MGTTMEKTEIRREAWWFSRYVMSYSCDPMDCSPPSSCVHGISRQEYWSGLPFPSPGDLPNPEIEGPKLLHFVNRKTPFWKVLGKEPLKIQEPLEIPWPHPTTLEPVGPQTKISWLNVQELMVYLGNGNQSEPVASPGNGNQSETNT